MQAGRCPSQSVAKALPSPQRRTGSRRNRSRFTSIPPRFNCQSPTSRERYIFGRPIRALQFRWQAFHATKDAADRSAHLRPRRQDRRRSIAEAARLSTGTPTRSGSRPSSDPIYKSIPFFIGVNNDGAAYGLFLDNSWRTSFDFGHRDASAIEIGAPDGPIDYYVIAGPTVADVVRRYTDLTGKAAAAAAVGPRLPAVALGLFQRCRGPRHRRAYAPTASRPT